MGSERLPPTGERVRIRSQELKKRARYRLAPPSDVFLTRTAAPSLPLANRARRSCGGSVSYATFFPLFPSRSKRDQPMPTVSLRKTMKPSGMIDERQRRNEKKKNGNLSPQLFHSTTVSFRPLRHRRGPYVYFFPSR